MQTRFPIALLGLVALAGCGARIEDVRPTPSLSTSDIPTTLVPSSTPLPSSTMTPPSIQPPTMIQDKTEAGAVAVVQWYYTAINAKNYAAAYALWQNGAPGAADETAFAKGFADTASVSVAVGTPGRIDIGAGNAYIEIPVTVTAKHTDATTHRYTGSYTLHRVNDVDGSSEASRHWHLSAAKLTEVK